MTAPLTDVAWLEQDSADDWPDARYKEPEFRTYDDLDLPTKTLLDEINDHSRASNAKEMEAFIRQAKRDFSPLRHLRLDHPTATPPLGGLPSPAHSDHDPQPSFPPPPPSNPPGLSSSSHLHQQLHSTKSRRKRPQRSIITTRSKASATFLELDHSSHHARPSTFKYPFLSYRGSRAGPGTEPSTIYPGIEKRQPKMPKRKSGG
ncbi:MAG: hypothetical protein Q9201_006812 [Fulgogasparrea decipioides]